MTRLTIPFDKIFSIFKNFKIDLDTKKVEELFEEQKVTIGIVIKRSWLFGLLNSRILIVTMILTFINIYNIQHTLGNTIYSNRIGIILFISLVLLIWHSVSFLLQYKTIYGDNRAKKKNELLEELKDGDKLFKEFFNQITTNIVIFFLIIIFYRYLLISSIFTDMGINSFFSPILDIFILFTQIYLMHHYRKKMMDLEMDFNIIIPGNIYFFNQSGINDLASQKLEAEKIKNINTDSKGFLKSLFNIGGIVILTEGDEGKEGMMQMYFIEKPLKTRDTIEYVVKYEIKEMSNNYFDKILKYLGFNRDNYNNPENLQIVLDFLKKNDQVIKEDYEKGDLIVKTEIKEIYTLLQNNK